MDFGQYFTLQDVTWLATAYPVLYCIYYILLFECLDNLIIFSNWTTGYYKHLFPLEIDPTVGWKVPLGWTFQSIYVLFLFIVFVVHINLKYFETMAGFPHVATGCNHRTFSRLFGLSRR